MIKMTEKKVDGKKRMLREEIAYYWIQAGIFDADQIISNTTKIVDFIEAQQLTVEQLEILISKESLSVQNEIKANIGEGNTIQDMLAWKIDKDRVQLKLLVRQFICSHGIKNPDEIIGMLKIIQQYTSPPLKYIKITDRAEEEKYKFRHSLMMHIAECNNYELPNIDIITTFEKLEKFIFHPD